METDRKISLKHGFWYSSFSGVIISIGLGMYFFLSSHSEWEALGAGLLAGGFLLIGPFAGFLISAIVVGLIFIPLYKASCRIFGLPILLLPITGSIVGLIVAFLFSMQLENLILPVYLIFAFWGALGGFLFVFGTGHHK